MDFTDETTNWFTNMMRNVAGYLKPRGDSSTFLNPLAGSGPVPTPVPTPTPPKREMLSPVPQGQPAPTPTPTPIPGQIPGGTDLAMNYITGLTPNGMSTESAYPALADQQFMQGITEADQLRQGLANLLLLQAFFESTGGRNSTNVFGVKPNNQAGSSFGSPREALDYQLSENVLGGGANPNMNILNTDQPLTLDDITNLYQSYNPESYYLDDLLKILGE